EGSDGSSGRDCASARPFAAAENQMNNVARIQALKTVALDPNHNSSDQETAVESIRNFLWQGEKAEGGTAELAMEEINKARQQRLKHLSPVETAAGAIDHLLVESDRDSLSRVSLADLTAFVQKHLLPVHIEVSLTDSWADSRGYSRRLIRILQALPY